MRESKEERAIDSIRGCRSSKDEEDAEKAIGFGDLGERALSLE